MRDGRAIDRADAARRTFELHSLLGEDGKLRVEVVWPSTERRRGGPAVKAGVYALAQLADEDRRAFIDRVDAVLSAMQESWSGAGGAARS